MTNWHRIFGLALTDLFTGSPYAIELEKDLSLRKQLLDVAIIRKTLETQFTESLPDGLDNLGEHSLITYKSLSEPLNAWAIKELIGHYVNYRKQISGKKLLPEKIFKLYAVATRFPKKLAKQVPLEFIQNGIYTLNWATDEIRLIVLSEIPKMKQNAFWCLLSSKSELIDWGVENYHQRTQDMSTVIKQMINMYKAEGITVSYTFEDFHRDLAREHLHLLSPNEVLSHYKSDEVLSHYKPDEVLSHYKPDEVLSHYKPDEVLSHYKPDEVLSHYKPDEVLSHYKPDEVLSHYKPDERLSGLTIEQIRTYLEKIESSKH